jgi:hypothetical protein
MIVFIAVFDCFREKCYVVFFTNHLKFHKNYINLIIYRKLVRKSFIEKSLFSHFFPSLYIQNFLSDVEKMDVKMVFHYEII